MPDLLVTLDAHCKEWFHVLYFSNIGLKSSLVLRVLIKLLDHLSVFAVGFQFVAQASMQLLQS